MVQRRVAHTGSSYCCSWLQPNRHIRMRAKLSRLLKNEISTRQTCNLSKEGKDPRPGLNGPKGKIFRKCVQIYRWIMKYNPKCKYLFENVVFDDMPDWHQMNRWLGKPVVIQARYYSNTSHDRERGGQTSLYPMKSFQSPGLWIPTSVWILEEH